MSVGALAKRFAARAKSLGVNSTDAEQAMWSLLRSRGREGHDFVRQPSVGPCRELASIIEVDGGQHSESRSDEVRTKFLNAEGYSVLRFWNDEVLENPESVYTTIALTIAGNPTPDWRYAPADLSPEGRGVRGKTASRNARLRARSPLPSGERSVRRTG